MKRVILYPLLMLLGWWILAFFIQRSMLYPTGYVRVPARVNKPADLREIWIDTPAGKVEAWFIAGKGITAEQPGPAVLFAHGNAELIDHNLDLLGEYRKNGISVMLCEYRGYGRSAGSPSQSAITEDFIQFFDLLAAMPEVDKSRIIFHGRSLGGGAVCALSEHRKPAAIILQSTFRSVKSIAAKLLLPAFLVRDPFDNEAALTKFDGPVLIFHGTRDSAIPHSHGVALSKIARDVTFIEYQCDHNDFPPNEAIFWRDVETFLKEVEMMK